MAKKQPKKPIKAPCSNAIPELNELVLHGTKLDFISINGGGGTIFAGDLNSLADNSIAKLTCRLGPDSLSSANIFDDLKQIYRVLADGAVVEISFDHQQASIYHSSVFAPLENEQKQQQRVAWATQLSQIIRSFLCSDESVVKQDPLHALGYHFQYIRSFHLFDIAANQKPLSLDLGESGVISLLDRIFYFATVKDNSKVEVETEQGKVAERAFTYALGTFPHIAPFGLKIYNPRQREMYVSRAILEQMVHEPAVSSIFNTIIKPRYSNAALAGRQYKLLNIGANIGWYSILACHCFEHMVVDAFEPTPDTLKLLEQNVALNRLSKRIHVYGTALSNEQGEAEFFINTMNAGSNSLANLGDVIGQQEIYQKTTVKLDTLDHIYGDSPKEQWPDIIMMDTEGHEQKIIEGAKELFAKGWRPVIFTEFSPLLMSLCQSDQMHFMLSDYGYKIYAVINNQLNHLNRISAEDLDKSYKQMVEQKSLAHYDLIFATDL